MELSAGEREMVRRARDFAARVVAPGAAGWDRGGGGLPRAVAEEYAALGLAGLQVSRERGGAGARFRCKLRVAEAIAAVCFPTAFALNNMQGSATRMEREGSADQVARFLPGLVSGAVVAAPSLTEPGAGSDLAAMRTVAVPDGAGWRVTGEKSWVTNGGLAGQLVLYAQTEPGRGARGIGSFLVDPRGPGVTRGDAERLEGGGAIGACSFRFEGAAAEVFAPPGTAFGRGMAGITGARVHVAAMICATVEGALRTAVAHAGRREAFGRTLLEHQGLRWRLVDVATALDGARLLVERAAGVVENGGDAQVEAALAKKAAAEMAGPAIAACMAAMGAAGLRAEHGLGRHLLAAGIAGVVDGTTEMMNERIGAALADRFGAAREEKDA